MCDRLLTLVNLPDHEVRLTEALLLSVHGERSQEQVEVVERALDALADRVRERCTASITTAEKLACLTHFLFTECGFCGNLDAYYDPRNSYLDVVLERRMGIPITLSVIYMEVARRVGLTLDAISFPFHFLLSPRDEDDLFVDAFHGGQQLTRRECRHMLERVSEGTVPFRTSYLEPVSTRDVALRVMRNLKQIYLREQDHLGAIECIDVMLTWDEGLAGEWRDRGLLYAGLGVWELAARDLAAYLELAPGARDRTRMRQTFEYARRKQRVLH